MPSTHSGLYPEVPACDTLLLKWYLRGDPFCFDCEIFINTDCCERSSRLTPNMYEACQLCFEIPAVRTSCALAVARGNTPWLRPQSIATHCWILVQLPLYKHYGIRVGSSPIVLSLPSRGTRTGERSPTCMRQRGRVPPSCIYQWRRRRNTRELAQGTPCEISMLW